MALSDIYKNTEIFNFDKTFETSWQICLNGFLSLEIKHLVLKVQFFFLRQKESLTTHCV